MSNDRTGENIHEFTVSEISQAVKRTIEGSFEHVRVRGELGRVSRPASGHVYLDLKDERAVLAGVMWKGVAGRLKIRPEQGMEVIVTGRLTSFPGQSKYQIIIESMEPAGEGALMALLEKLKRKLAAEGLLAEERKHPLPFLPRLIGIVTSPSGAVIRDMMHGFEERFPAHIIVWPVAVQGENCARQVAAAIRGFNALDENSPIGRPEVLIVARGGGSLEDLWGFNEEIVARAAAASEIPIISAIGHETDWSILDLVADARAPTPTKAAEWAVPKHSELLERLGDFERRLHLTQRRMIEERRSRLLAAARGLPRLSDLLALPRQRLDDISRRHAAALATLIRDKRSRLERARLAPQTLLMQTGRGRERLDALAGRLNRAATISLERRRSLLETKAKLLKSLSHKSTLARGFAIVRNEKGRMMRTASAIRPGQRLDVELADGHVKTRAEGKAAPSPKSKTARKPRNPASDGSQGSLF